MDSDGDGSPDNEAMMPYHSVEEMTPEAILAYYDGIAGKDGEPGFYDWIQEATGTRMLKAQHPEMETYLQSVHARNGLNCADCHMAIEMQEDGTVNHSHELVSPLASQTIRRFRERRTASPGILHETDFAKQKPPAPGFDPPKVLRMDGSPA